MTPTIIVLISLGLGIVIGGLSVLAFFAAKHTRAQRAEQLNPSLPKAAVNILEHLAEAAVLLDPSLSVVYANPAAQEHQLRIDDSIFTEPEFLQEMRRVIRHGAPYLRMPETPPDTTRVRAFRVKKDFVAVLLDDIGKEQRLDHVRRDFIANISHELKTPIAAISLLSEATEQASDDTEAVQRFVRSLRQELSLIHI